jgi:hypothetical protein
MRRLPMMGAVISAVSAAVLFPATQASAATHPSSWSWYGTQWRTKSQLWGLQSNSTNTAGK